MPVKALPPTVVARLAAEHGPRVRPGRTRMRARAGIAAAAAVVATVLVVPASRGAIARFFGIGSTRIERPVDTTAVPPATFPAALALGDPVEPADASIRTGLPVPLAPSLGEPLGVFASGAGEPEQVIVVYPPGPSLPPSPVAGTGALLSTVRGLIGPGSFVKVVAGDTTVEDVLVTTSQGVDVRGVWLEGQPHLYAYDPGDGDMREGTLRLATNTLLWEIDGVAFRLEASITKEQAIAIAASVVVAG